MEVVRDVGELEGGARPETLALRRPIVRIGPAFADKSARHRRSATPAALHERSGGAPPARPVGPSEFESESLAPQARRMDQATPRPRAAPVARGPRRLR